MTMRTGWRIITSTLIVVATFGVATAVGAISGAAGRDDAFRIDRFVQTIEVAPDGTPQVTEELLVTFTEERRGIFRDLDERAPFPSSGGYRDITVDQGEASRPWNLALERWDHGPRVRIGEASTWLPPGTYPYRIRYTAPTWTVTLRDDPSLVELRVDTPGFDWPTTVGPTTVVVDLPGEPVEAACVSGPRRSTRVCPSEPRIDGTQVTFDLGPFEPREAATIAVRLPASAFTVAPPTFDPAPLDSTIGPGPWDLSRSAAALLLAVLLALPFAVWEAVAARKVYRDRVTDPTLHDRAQPTALPAPPFGFRPPEIAGLLSRTAGQSLLLSAIVDLDQRGLLRTSFSEQEGGFLRSDKRTLTLDRPAQGTVLPKGDDEVVHTLVPAHGPTVFDGSYDSAVAARASATSNLLSARASGVFADHGFEHDEGGPMRSGLFRFAAFVVWLGFAAMLGFLFAYASPIPGVVVAIVAALVVIGWALARAPWRHHARPLNSQGRDAVGQARAFDHFVRTVEGEQLEWAAGQPGLGHDHPALTLLPYAIALGHADSWYDRFGPVLKALTAATAGAGAAGAGAWWASQSSFTGVATAQAGTSTAPSSSGGGGGGGGSGGGGGGGGSW
jgi:hypothetical protein